MNLEKLIKLVLENPENIKITYSNIDGEEKLFINDEEITSKESFDDSEIKKRVSKFKQIMDELDSCTLTEACDEISEHICLKELDDFLNKEHYTEEESQNLNILLDKISNVIKETINEKTDHLDEIYRML